MNNHIDTSKGKYIDITKLEKIVRDNEYSFICEEGFSYYPYGMPTDDFIDLINDCKRVNLGKAVSKRTPKKVASEKVTSSKKALLYNFCPSCYKKLL